MWLNDLFWGKRNTFVGRYHFSVINDALSACGQILQKNQVRGQTPPHSGNSCILGTFYPASPPIVYYIERLDDYFYYVIFHTDNSNML